MIGESEDFEDMLDCDEFAVEARSPGLPSFPVIFDNPRDLIALGEVGIDSEVPQAIARFCDAGALVEGDEVTIGGQKYTLARDADSDGTGSVVLYFRKL